ncbi:MAG: polymer-forming cytoskeletal protein [Bacteroidia bacterium]
MFGKNETNGRPAESTSRAGTGGTNTIAKGTVIEGNITADGDMRIEGKVVGTLVCSSKLVVSNSGSIEGSVDARNAVVEGEIKGNVVARELLQIDKSGTVQGDIFTQKLVVQMGATFTGNCKMGDAAKEVLNRKPNRAGEGQQQRQGKPVASK